MVAGHAGSKWRKEGKIGSDPIAPGSYGGYVKPRSRPSAYKKLPQQEKVGQAGRKMGGCKGKSGSDFRECRHKIMQEVFGIP